MKRKRIILTVGVCVLVLVVAGFALWPKESEPVYQGMSLSYWAVQFASRGDETSRDALRAIGTNALPFLLQWTRYEPGVVQRKMIWVADKISPNSRKGIYGWLRGAKKERRAYCALRVFTALREKAAPAVPELVRLMNDTTHPFTANIASLCLQEIGAQDPNDILF